MSEGPKPFLQQRWEKVCFLHLRGPASAVKSALPSPLELDCFDGDAILSLVPFRMSHIRVRGLKAPACLGDLWEYNLRTYVRHHGRAGVYFFTLETDHALAAWIARTFFNLNYRRSQITAQQQGQELDFRHRRTSLRSHLRLQLDLEDEISSPLQTWATERYSLFTVRNQRVFRGDVTHAPWRLRPLQVLDFEENLSSLIGSDSKKFRLVEQSCCEQIDVSFQPFYEVKNA